MRQSLPAILCSPSATQIFTSLYIDPDHTSFAKLNIPTSVTTLPPERAGRATAHGYRPRSRSSGSGRKFSFMVQQYTHSFIYIQLHTAMQPSDFATVDPGYLIDFSTRRKKRVVCSRVKSTATKSLRYSTTSQSSIVVYKHLKQQHKNLHSIILIATSSTYQRSIVYYVSPISASRQIPLHGVYLRL